MTLNSQEHRKYLKDYKPFPYQIEDVHMTFNLDFERTLVTSQLFLKRISAFEEPLILDGVRDHFRSVAIDGRPLKSDEYTLLDETLTLSGLPRSCSLEIQTEISPALNRSAMGIYKSGPVLCSQMEAEGFRRVTFFPDRPDVMTRYTVTLEAERSQFPVLLSNGNLIEAAAVEGKPSRHKVKFYDPFPKPSYLFAVVAGDLALVADTYITTSGRKVSLEFYVEHGNEHLCAHALKSLKEAMRWDEEVFGLEYDLDTFRVVSVGDFNFGAMENKSLNIFNNQYVLADPLTATDTDLRGVQRVIAHEYFHNWTGNRVTCQSWFHLTLKEGLTVFRDQEFCADMNSRGLERIRAVAKLRSSQFVEDDGPNAHPIRPDSYVEIDNFYTSTVYNKGAEVIRMIRTLLGSEQFIAGVKHYLKKFDGCAVTVSDFIDSMHEVSNFDFTQFFNWYTQAGTPQVKVSSTYDSKARTFTLTLEQSCPATPGQATKEPFLIPFSLALLDPSGGKIPLTLDGELSTLAPPSLKTLSLIEERQSFRFKNVSSEPVPSLLREFSAPIKVDYPWREEELIHLLRFEDDGFVKFESWNQLSLTELRRIYFGLIEGSTVGVSSSLTSVVNDLINDPRLDPALKAFLIIPPSVTQVLEGHTPYNYRCAKDALRNFSRDIGIALESPLLALFEHLNLGLGDSARIDSEAMGMRSLRAAVAHYLLATNKAEYRSLMLNQIHSARSMNDSHAALIALCDYPSGEKEAALSHFRETWRANPLAMNKWFQAQALADDPAVLEGVKALAADPLFDRFNPNKLRSLYGSLGSNAPWFHAASGECYSFMGDKILEIDTYNSSVAANLATAFVSYSKVDAERRAKIKEVLSAILACKTLSRGVQEIVKKTLDSE